MQLASAQEKQPLQETKEEFDARTQWFADAKIWYVYFGLYSQLCGVWKRLMMTTLV